MNLKNPGRNLPGFFLLSEMGIENPPYPWAGGSHSIIFGTVQFKFPVSYKIAVRGISGAVSQRRMRLPMAQTAKPA